MGKKQDKELIKTIKLAQPKNMSYNIAVPQNSKDRDKLVKRIESEIRRSMEYRDYIQFLKQHVGLDSCIFFQNVSTAGGKKKRVSIELHHEPFTLYDYVNVVLQKFIDSGLPLNTLLIADEVLEIHYANKVGLIPVSKTAHEIIHNSSKLLVPLNMCYGSYSDFLDEYDEFITDDMGLYEKLEKKIDMTNNLTPESFDAIMKEFTYLDISGVEDVEKLELNSGARIA